MKKTAICLSLVAFVLLAGCASKKSVETQPVKPAVTDHSFLNNNMIGSDILITGLLTGSFENGFVVTEKAGSRGAVTFILEKDDSIDYENLGEYCNQIVTVKGTIKDAARKWTKVLEFKQIVE